MSRKTLLFLSLFILFAISVSVHGGHHGDDDWRERFREQKGPGPPPPPTPKSTCIRVVLALKKMLPAKFSNATTSMPSAKTIVATAASIAASAMVVRSIAREIVPYELQHFIFSKIRELFKSFSSELTLIIEDCDGYVSNQIYKAAEIYLGTKASLSTKTFKVSMPEKETKMSTSIARNEAITDVFNGVRLHWRQMTVEVEHKQDMYSIGRYSSSSRSLFRYFELRFHKKHKQMVLDSYFPFILKEAEKLQREKKTLKIYTLGNDQMRYGGSAIWSSVNLDHPSTFKTLAMDDEIKKTIMEDLERFVQRKELYKRVGKAWKRGYLLYGPPGTGKSSLVAAMANYLKFDIYDLELSHVHNNSALRSLLIGTANKCILVVEDIDCSLAVEHRAGDKKMLQMNQGRQAQTINIVQKDKMNQVTLSGLLNFIDGLWSSCGDERIIVFTTNHKYRLDPALLRPGRMDVHINMSYCTPCGFRTLASNYLGVNEHFLFAEIEALLKPTMVTPAEVGEQLLRHDSPEGALQGLLQFLLEKQSDIDEMVARNLIIEDGEDDTQSDAEASPGLRH